LSCQVREIDIFDRSDIDRASFDAIIFSLGEALDTTGGTKTMSDRMGIEPIFGHGVISSNKLEVTFWNK